MTDFSEYIVYADESGDHNLNDPTGEYPVFVFSCCVFEKQAYSTDVKSKITDLKFRYWGHDALVLHSHKIRKQKEEFKILGDQRVRSEFYSGINEVVKASPFALIATVIDKHKLTRKYAQPYSPYDLALEFCIERIRYFLKEKRQLQRLTHLVVESRGRKEDDALELAFRRIIQRYIGEDGSSFLEIQFATKATNSAGLQLADLCAYPIGRKILKPEEENRAYDVLETKFHRYPNHVGKGLKIFPS